MLLLASSAQGQVNLLLQRIFLTSFFSPGALAFGHGKDVIDHYGRVTFNTFLHTSILFLVPGLWDSSRGLEKGLFFNRFLPGFLPPRLWDSSGLAGRLRNL